MADTGAPWNIPYVEPADLVRDYPAADEAQAVAIAAGLTGASNAGIGDNVVSTLRTTAFSTSSTSFQEVLNVVITPTSATSKILVMLTGLVGNSSDQHRSLVSLDRNGTVIAQTSAGGTANQTWGNYLADTRTGSGMAAVFLDSPGVATAVTYKALLRTANAAGTAYMGRYAQNNDFPSVTILTVIEVKA